MIARTPKHLAWLLAGTFLLTACADSAAGGGDDPEAGTDMSDPLPTSDMGAPPAVVGARSLEIVGGRDASSVFIQYGDTVPLKVVYRGVDRNGQPVPIPNASLRARILDDRGNDLGTQHNDGSVLRSARATSNAQGEGTFELTGGERDAQFQVEVCAGDCNNPGENEADPVRFSVAVQREGAGALTVRVTYSDMGRYEFRHLQSAVVHLFDGQDCELLFPAAANLRGAYFTLPPIEPFNEVDNSVSVGDLNDGARFSVAVQGTNQNGNVITFGCQDGVEITGGTNTRIDIEMRDLPLEFKGTYNVTHEFNLLGLLESSGNETLAVVGDVLEILQLLGDDSGERGQRIVDEICDLANVDEGLCRILRTIGGRLIDEAIERWVPPNVLNVFNAISDVLSIFTELTVLGEFQMNSIDRDGRIEGNDNRWQRFRFTWRLNCPMGDDCIRTFPLSDLALNDRPIFGTFSAELDGPNMYIEPHGITFRYGLIILGIITNWVVPAFVDLDCDPDPGDREADGCGLEAIIAAIVPCDQINDFLTGDPNDGLCERVLVASIAEILVDQLSGLEFSAGEFMIDGEAEPIDEDGDLTIDKLSMGVWNGVIDAGDLQLEFRGCFEACRPPANDDCVPADCVVPQLEQPEE